VRGLWVIEGAEEPVAGVDLDVHHGEVHGLVGSGGRGPLELVEALAGLRSPEGGRVYLGNEDVVRSGVRARRALGLGYLPPADGPDGLVGSMRLWENAALGSHRHGRLQRLGLLSRRALGAVAAEQAASVGVAAHPRLHARMLSRGERQLVALARELGERPVALIAACPTRGLGRHAAEQVWARLRAARDAGAAVLQAAAVLYLALLAALLCERAGLINLGLEGVMLAGAWVGAMATPSLGPAAGLGLAVLAGAGFALLQALATIRFRVDQVVVGLALNVLAFGAVRFLQATTLGSSGRSADLQRLPAVCVPRLGQLSPLVPVVAALGLAIWLGLRFSRAGLRLRAVAEAPQAAARAGLSLARLRCAVLLASGALAGLAGAGASL
jgi:ABC-type branched-subunit amino acid transport system ATPase component